MEFLTVPQRPLDLRPIRWLCARIETELWFVARTTIVNARDGLAGRDDSSEPRPELQVVGDSHLSNAVGPVVHADLATGFEAVLPFPKLDEPALRA
jgi:hypothetical protein